MRRLVVFPLLSALALAGTAVPASAGSSPLEDVEVAGAVGEKPTVTFTKPFSTKKTIHRDITAGTGGKLGKGDKVTFNYLALDARTGKEIESSFDKKPGTIVLDKKQAVTGIVKSLVGTTVGSRVLIALAPKEGLTAGLRVPGVKKSDTLLFVADVTALRAPLERATGTSVTPPEGLPTVKLARDGSPEITVPGSAAPNQLVVQPLVTGDGPVVTAGQTITVHYTGIIWDSGKQFDSSWERGTPVDFAIGDAQVIAGWDEGLVGQTVGSQVLLVVPPDKGYGTSGNPNAGISGTDTLVFVVDILDAF